MASEDSQNEGCSTGQRGSGQCGQGSGQQGNGKGSGLEDRKMGKGREKRIIIR